jgi:hypothetical protein
MQYTATCGPITLRVFLGPGVPHLFIEDRENLDGVVCIRADDATAIKLLRQSLTHIVDTHKHREEQSND